MAVFKTKSKGYKNTKTGKYYSSKSAALAASKSSSGSSKVVQAVSGSRSDMLSNLAAQAANLQKMLNEPSTKLSQSQIDTLYNQVSGARNAVQTYANSLPKTTAPDIAGITPMVPQTQIPDITMGQGNPLDAFAGIAGQGDFMKVMQEANAKMLEYQNQQALKQQEQTKSLAETFFGKNPSLTPSADAREAAWKETGMDVAKYFADQQKGIKEIETLKGEYDNLVAARDAQIAQTNDRMGSMNFINNRTAQINRNADVELNRVSSLINSKAAVLEAQQGNFAQAQAYVNQAVQDATADLKYRADMFKMYYDINSDIFDKQNKALTDAFTISMNLAQAEYERAYDEKMKIGELMLKYGSAGITMNDSFEQAVKKASAVGGGSDLTADMKNFLFAQDNPAFAAWMDKNGSNSMINFTEIMQQAIDSGWTPEQAAREAAIASENTGIPVDQKTLSAWTSFAKTLTKTPVYGPVQPVGLSTPFVGGYVGDAYSAIMQNYTPQGGIIGSIGTSLFGD